jgi:hypothetical protein
VEREGDCVRVAVRNEDVENLNGKKARAIVFQESVMYSRARFSEQGDYAGQDAI